MPSLQQQKFDRLARAIGLPLTQQQRSHVWWLADMDPSTCEIIAELFDRVRASELPIQGELICAECRSLLCAVCGGSGTVEVEPSHSQWEHGCREQEACHECCGSGRAKP